MSRQQKQLRRRLIVLKMERFLRSEQQQDLGAGG